MYSNKFGEESIALEDERTKKLSFGYGACIYVHAITASNRCILISVAMSHAV